MKQALVGIWNEGGYGTEKDPMIRTYGLGHGTNVPAQPDQHLNYDETIMLRDSH